MTERNERRKDIVLAFVKTGDVMNEECYFIKNTLENIAAFIVKDQQDKIIFDTYNNFVLDTFGSFINQCPDKQFLQELLQVLVPIQMGEVEPQAIEKVEI